MNYAESFEEFASRLSSMDIALYAGAGLVLWVLFKDKLSPVQEFIGGLVSKTKKEASDTANMIAKPFTGIHKQEDVFFKLVESWKKTRDLAVQSDCEEAVKVADQMFPFLSPSVCSKSKEITK